MFHLCSGGGWLGGGPVSNGPHSSRIITLRVLDSHVFLFFLVGRHQMIDCALFVTVDMSCDPCPVHPPPPRSRFPSNSQTQRPCDMVGGGPPPILQSPPEARRPGRRRVQAPEPPRDLSRRPSPKQRRNPFDGEAEEKSRGLANGAAEGERLTHRTPFVTARGRFLPRGCPQRSAVTQGLQTGPEDYTETFQSPNLRGVTRGGWKELTQTMKTIFLSP